MLCRHDFTPRFYRFPLCNMLHVALCAFGQPRGCRGNYLRQRGGYLWQRGEYLGRRREYLGRRREYLGQRGEYLGRRGEYLGQRREYLGQRGGLLWRRGGYLGRPAVGLRHYRCRRQSPRLAAPSGGVAERGLSEYGCDDGGLIASGSRAVRASRRAGCRHRRSPLRRAYVPGRWSCP